MFEVTKSRSFAGKGEILKKCKTRCGKSDPPFTSLVAGQNEDGRLETITNLNGILALVTQSEPGVHSAAGLATQASALVQTPEAL